MSDSSSTDQKTRSGKTPAGVKRGLPEVGLRQAEESARSLWDVARHGKASKKVFGNEIGMTSTSGGSFNRRMAVLNGFGLIETDGDKVGLSELGLNIVQDSDEEKQVRARRSAIQNHKAYGNIVETFSDTKLLPKDRLAAQFEFDYGKSKDFASQAAEAFIDSLTFAGMLDESGFVRTQGAAVTANAVKIAEDDNFRGSASEDVAPGKTANLTALGVEDVGAGETGSSRLEDKATSITLSVSLDLSRFEADDVIRILDRLGVAE